MLNISIGNMLAIEQADLQMEFGKITGITGMNAVGKTSLATIAAAVLTGYDSPAGNSTKTKIYLKRETDAGSTTLTVKDQPVTKWDAVSGQMSVFESDYKRPHSAAVGLIDFCAQMSPAQRTGLWEQFFLPPKKVLSVKIERQLKEHINDELLKRIMETIEESELDVVLKTYQARAKNEKQEWMKVTGETWGKAKGADWLPDNWTSDLDGKSVKMAKQELQYEQDQLRSLHVEQAITRSDIEKAKEYAQKAEELDEKIAELRVDARKIKPGVDQRKKTVDEIDEHINDLIQQQRDHGRNKPIKENTLKCPECDAALLLKNFKLVKHEEEIFQTTLEIWEEENKALTEKLLALKAQHETVYDVYKELKAEFDDIVFQGKALVSEKDVYLKQAALADAEPTDDNRRMIEEAEKRIDALKAKIELIEAREQAKQHHKNIIDYTVIADIVGPKGVRAVMMNENIEKFDEILETISTVTAWPRIELDKTYAVSIDGSTFLRLTAETDRLRAQYTLQIALARFTRSNAIILDAVDHLDDVNMFALSDLLTGVCSREDPPAVMICGTELDLYAINRNGLNYRIVNGKSTPI